MAVQAVGSRVRTDGDVEVHQSRHPRLLGKDYTDRRNLPCLGGVSISQVQKCSSHCDMKNVLLMLSLAFLA